MATGIPALAYTDPVPTELILKIADHLTDYQETVPARWLLGRSAGPWLETLLRGVDINPSHLDPHIQRFRSVNTFRFDDAIIFQRFDTLIHHEALQAVRSIEIDNCWLYANFELIRPDYHSFYLIPLRQYSNLRQLTLRIGSYHPAHSRWMDVRWAVRQRTYRRSLRYVADYLPDLPADLQLKLIMDSTAQWDGGLPEPPERTIVTIVAERDADGGWAIRHVTVEEQR